MAKRSSFHVKVAGVTFSNPDGKSRQKIIYRCSKGEPVKLIREPENPNDSNAVKVVRWSGEQIGYLPAHVASTIAHNMDHGFTYRAAISNITGQDTDTWGVNLKLTIYNPGEEVPWDTEEIALGISPDGGQKGGAGGSERFCRSLHGPIERRRGRSDRTGTSHGTFGGSNSPETTSGCLISFSVFVVLVLTAYTLLRG